MKKLIFSFFSLLAITQAFGKHISGGEMSYVYLGPGTNPGTLKYQVTLKLYRECNAPPDAAQLDPAASFTIFRNSPYQQLMTVSGIPGSAIEIIQKVPDNPCIDDDIETRVCFQTRTYTTVIDNLPITVNGLTVAYQRCCRIDGMTNISSDNIGSTYFAVIPGNNIPGAETNSSPVFASHDDVLICSGRPMSFDFSATDPDGDSLAYQFFTAFSGGSVGNTAPSPTSTPPFPAVDYNSPYTFYQPLGSLVTINPTTGLISGKAPNLGAGANAIFAVTVLVKEYRGGVLIGTHFKDLQVRVVDCRVSVAALNPRAATCDGFTVNFQNDFVNNPEPTYYWDFGDGFTSTQPTPSHTYAAAGTYTYKLVVDRGLPCSDSTTAQIRVYPGFFPDYSSIGSCTNSTIQFNDQTTTNYPPLNSWTWNFGDGLGSNVQNPTHVYTASGTYSVSMIVTSEKGCIDTVRKDIVIYDSPPLTVPNDTLICNIDTIQLNTVGTGSFNWTPNYMISSTTSPNPLVSPDVTTTYYVTLSDAFGCSGTDSVKVNVVDHVTLNTRGDTSVCQGDPVLLKTTGDGLRYVWTPSSTLNDPTFQSPTATPTDPSTTYHVVSTIGKCRADADVTIKTVPYPAANAGPDREICLGSSAQLLATGGSQYVWSPATFLDNPHIANPRAINPTAGVRYVVTVRDTLGCPKPVRDTVLLLVDKVIAYAGSPDTSVVLGQPLQLHAYGGTNYLWTPSTWLSNTTIPDPIALPQSNIRYFVTVSNNIGCSAKTSIMVRVFTVDAGLYVPNAFSPNGDGLNDRFAPILVGMRSLDLFRVYNRWGQLVFSGTDPANGWDGTLGGNKQGSGTYVWYAEGTDYKGEKIKKKGSVLLIR